MVYIGRGIYRARNLFGKKIMVDKIFANLNKILFLVLGVLTLITINNLTPENPKKLYGNAVLKIMSLNHTSGCTAWSTRLPHSHKRVVVTNSHCAGFAINGAILARHPDGKEEVLNLIFDSPNTDVSVFTGTVYPTQDLELANALDKDTKLIVLGHPALRDLIETDGDYVQDEIARFPTNIEPKDCTQPKMSMMEVPFIFGMKINLCVISIKAQSMTAMLYPGNSGSPVIQHGRVVGIGFAAQDGFNIGLMVPLKDLFATLLETEAQLLLNK